MDDLPRAAGDSGDPVAHPTRARLLDTLSELGRPAGTSELAAALDLHPNGVRVHLSRLSEAGLVRRERVAQARGRPRDGWSVTPSARPVNAGDRGYALLSRWLARATAPTAVRLRETEAAGREIGRELAPAGADALDGVRDTLTALGFAPSLERSDSGVTVFSLGNCPYRDAVRENQPVVCTLHRGISRGLLDVLDPHARLEEFTPKDPDRAGCLIAIARPPRREDPGRPDHRREGERS